MPAPEIPMFPIWIKQKSPTHLIGGIIAALISTALMGNKQHFRDLRLTGWYQGDHQYVASVKGVQTSL